MGAPDRLILTVDSCHGAPRVSMSQETDVDVRVNVIAFSTPFHGGLRCQEGVNVYLKEPLDDRVIVDLHTGQTFSDALQPYADAQPQRDWRIVEVSGRRVSRDSPYACLLGGNCVNSRIPIHTSAK